MTPSRREFFSFLAVGSFAAAQNPATYAVYVKVVNVLATVRNKKGQIVKDLKQDSFVMEEDGRAQTIKYFVQHSDLPLTLGLLIDTSGSMRRLIDTERSASRQFFNQVLREDKDMAFLIHFDREVELLQDLTSSRKALDKGLDELGADTPQQMQRRQPGQGGPGSGGRRRGGGTALYDSLLLASDELMRKQQGRKAVLLLSDGDDRGSKVGIRESIDAAQRADTLVYAIRYHDEAGRPGGFGGPGGRGGMGGGRRGGMGRMPPPRQAEERTDGKKVLQQIARETGGGYFEVSKKHTLDQIYTQIQEELRNQYSLGYSSDKPATSPEYRKIKLAAKDKSLIVQTRDGYYTK